MNKEELLRRLARAEQQAQALYGMIELLVETGQPPNPRHLVIAADVKLRIQVIKDYVEGTV